MYDTIRRRICAFLLALLLLLLCGCGAIQTFKQDMADARAEADELLIKMMTCVENNDAQGASALAYAPQEMLAGFASIASSWPVHAGDEFESAGLNVTKNKDSDGGTRTVVDAVYIVHCEDQDYQVQFSTCEDAGGSGFTGFQVFSVQSLVDNGIEPAGADAPAAKKSFGQWCVTVFWILSCLFCLATVIDIVLRRPKRWVLWILAALVFFGLQLTAGPYAFHVGFRGGILNSSRWIRYTDGTNFVEVCFPVGAIVYWILRKRLLKKESAPAYAVPLENAPEQAQMPDQDHPE